MFASILTFIIVLSILVLVHEFGHYIVAKKSGILVEEFGLGLPFAPKIFGKKIGETTYSIYPVLFGGFVRLHGELTEDGVTDHKRAFINQKSFTKVKVITAGVIMNLILGIVCFSIIYSVQGIPKPGNNVTIIDVAPGTPASDAQLPKNSIVKKVNYVEVTSEKLFIEEVAKFKGSEISLTLLPENSEESKVFKITPRSEYPEGQGPLGIVISTPYETYFPPIWQRPFLGVYYGFQEAFFWGSSIALSLFELIKNLFSGIVPKGLAGPAGLYVITDETRKAGILPLISLLGVVSINLAILNILPIPALDGGRLLFILIEKLFGRKIVPKVEAAIHGVAMVILVGLMVLVTIKEVITIRRVGFSGYLNEVMMSGE
ncbi:MAG TPA: M50 family metallopeptidase [Patescibacteria group bacterium]|nr:M50 family metallopeptidase [Patescibacteria group bacterium]